MDPTTLELTLVPAGRQLTFSQQERQRVHVYRRVASESMAWQQVAYDARSPFVDTEAFPAATTLEYHVQYFTQQDQYEGHSYLVGVRLA
jgi:hypothetical protein